MKYVFIVILSLSIPVMAEELLGEVVDDPCVTVLQEVGAKAQAAATETETESEGSGGQET